MLTSACSRTRDSPPRAGKAQRYLSDRRLMENQFIGIIVFALLSIASAIFFHFKFQKLLMASFLSALTASFVFQMIGFFVVGYLDPFFFIAFMSTFIISFVFSILVGAPFAHHRKVGKTNNDV